jgi:hypothetical protein
MESVVRTGIASFFAISLFLSTAGALAQAPQPSAALRTVYDPARNQFWVLQRDGVYLHDASTRALKQRFELPDWIYVRRSYSCAPDLAIDARGAAVVSSNVVPVLWRVDPVKSTVTRHELVLDTDADKDIGFTGLVYAPDQGVFFAASAAHGTLWRIDPLLRRAQRVPLSAPVTNACAMALEQTKTRRTVVLVLCPQDVAQSGWVAHLTPDQRSAYVSARFCVGEQSLQQTLTWRR